jgi:phosphoribosylglycinamide formyltransferase, formyltetrahydrofolate-dependent
MQDFAHYLRICAKFRGFMKTNIAVFASGNGTNAENIIRHFTSNEHVGVSLVVSNRQNAFVLERAKALSIDVASYPKDEWCSGDNILLELCGHKIDFIVLAGFLARIPTNIVHAYPDKIINIHPSLLPRYGGKGMYGDFVHEAVLAAGEKESGITIHYVNEHYDEGAVICQIKCPVLPKDTLQTLSERVHELEYKYYPSVIEKLLIRL